MAKRGNQSQSSGIHRKGKQRNYGRPEVKWAVGDEELDSLTSDIPQQFSLSSGKDAKKISVFQVEERPKPNTVHELIRDDRAATRFGNTDYVPRKPKSTLIASKSPVSKAPASKAPVRNDSETSTYLHKTTNSNSSDTSKPLDSTASIFAPTAQEPSSANAASSISREEPTALSSEPTPPRPLHRTDSQSPGAQNPTSSEADAQNPEYSAYRRNANAHSDIGHDSNSGAVAEPGLLVNEQDSATQHIAPQSRVDSGILRPYLGASGASRAGAIRGRLDKALDEWWEFSVLPSTALLRDGLLVLEAGHSLDEVHRTLLLRTSLAKRRGMVTAVGHQMDPDRSAFLIKDALLEQQHPFMVDDISYLLAEGRSEPEWAELLLDELEYDYPQMPADKQRTARSAIDLLKGQLGSSRGSSVPPSLYRDAIYDVAVNGTEPQIATPPVADAVQVELSAPSYWNVGRIVLVLLLVAALFATWRWLEGRTTLTDMVVVPGGAYIVGNSASTYAERQVSFLSGYAIDRTEVTNADYRLCYEQGDCLPPSEFSSATHQSYFLNPTFDSHPVVFVDWASANQYCLWAGKRLPTDEEWEIAATNAPATKRHYIYPWGDRFNRLYANSAESNLGDTQPAGSYYPSGTSSIGAEDMAGNVAEWTATERSSSAYDSYIVKGGSYLDSPELLWSSRSVPQPANFSSAWLGFRCMKILEPQS